MTGLINPVNQDLITRLRSDIQRVFADRLRIKMYINDFSEDHPGENKLDIFFTSDIESNGATGEEPEPAPAPVKLLVGIPRDYQQFLNKEGPSYEEEFMLDLEIDYDTLTLTVHHINLPGHLRNRGLGSRIVGKIEQLAREMGMEAVYIPSEHRATSFWLKNGYAFAFTVEKAFYEKNRDRSDLYVAYDLRKKINS
ncbi:MAG: GNAT family N-acetyltransferase [Peptococcaceae bacterium]|nr:GNAT family N-acetyltransferase [Peptococcaceae bacterium]